MLFLGGLGFILHHFFFEDEHVPFIMELPLYHLPNIKTIGLYVWHNLVSFLQKAGTTILVASLIIWAVSYFPGGGVMNSYLAVFGKALEPIGHWMGLPWPMLVALLTSLVAKENTIATLGVLYGNLNTALPALIPAAAVLGMLVFQMLFIPCVGTIAAIYQETRSLRWTAASLTIMLFLSFGMGVLVYQIGRLV
jgi:ferrous iron transport protein B